MTLTASATARGGGLGWVEAGRPMAVDVIARPPAIVAAATLEAEVVDGPHPLRERRRGAGG